MLYRKYCCGLAIILNFFAMVAASHAAVDITDVDPTPTQTMVGDIASSFDVSAMGAATYSIPLIAPSGVQGMEPKLALSYSSASGEGLLGPGWSLAGLSAITRCPQTLLQDGASKAISNSADDRFCLDGQRLMLVSGAAYGADGSTYRTELDSFSKVVAHGNLGGGPAWFEVFSKSGRRSEYGSNGTYDTFGSGNVATTWYVSRVEDLSHNYMTYSYYSDTTNGRMIPLQIQYTKNDANNDSGVATIDFQYRQINYRSTTGATVPLRRLARITATGVANSDEADPDTTKVYIIQYTQQTTNRNRLSSIRLCSRTMAICTTAGDFQWTAYVRGSETLDFITAFNPSYSTQAQVQYKSLSDSAVYVKDTAQDNKKRNIVPLPGGIVLKCYRQFSIGDEYFLVNRPEMYVVSTASVSDGIGGWANTDYRYTNLRTSMKVVSRCMSRLGRGLSGFERIESINQSKRLRSRTDYSYVFPYVGMVVSQEKRLCLGDSNISFSDSCSLLESVQNQFEKKVNGNLVFPYVKTSTKTRYEPPAGVNL